MDRELLYNRSGVRDETAYKAIIRSGRDKKEMSTCEINKGEIWETDNNGSIRLVVVIACFEKYAATIMLQDQETASNPVKVRARDVMYADAGRLGYTYYDKMVDYVRTLSHEEEQELCKEIAGTLKLDMGSSEACGESLAAATCEVAELREELEKAKEEIDNKAEELEAAANRVAALEEEKKTAAVQGTDDRGLREELAAATREAAVYKHLYEDMLARALG